MSVKIKLWQVPTLGLLALAAACGNDQTNDSAAVGPADAAQTAAQVSPAGDAGAGPATDVTTPAGGGASAVQPAPGNEVIEVRMVMPNGANPAYVPSQITARPGDVIRFVNSENVHNVHFVKGPAGATLPPASPYLTQPGQTYDLKVDLPAGAYDFQCDPHVALGMVGNLTVQ